MGYELHHAIVVVGRQLPNLADQGLSIEDAHRVAREHCGVLVTDIVWAELNGVGSFMVGADGSKDGWAESDDGDRARDAFVDWLRAKERRDYFSWCEVGLGEDDRQALVTRDAWDYLVRRGR